MKAANNFSHQKKATILKKNIRKIPLPIKIKETGSQGSSHSQIDNFFSTEDSLKANQSSEPKKMINIIPKFINFQPPKEKDKQVPIQYSTDNLEVTGAKGWCSCLVNFPIIEGTFYCEFTILPPKEPLPFSSQVTPHIRIGVGTSQINYEMPLGSQSYSYSYRDTDGSVFHDAFSKEYGQAYGVNDVIGILIFLAPPKPKSKDPCMYDKDTKKLNEGSLLFFFKNGLCQGEAFRNLKEGFYFIGISLYMQARARLNAGPVFQYTIDPSTFNYPNINTIQPLCEIIKDVPQYEDIKWL